jgi:hypothetical protein
VCQLNRAARASFSTPGSKRAGSPGECPDECERALSKLIKFCRSRRWAGYDPYDGLNSPLAGWLSGRASRTALTQLVKLSPVNLRPLLGIKPGLNSKAIALGFRALVLLSKRFGLEVPAELCAADAGGSQCSHFIDGLISDLHFLSGTLESLRSNSYNEPCWGYNFDWQSRAFFAPRGTPNVVCTTMAAHAFIDWYEAAGNERALDIARASGEFLLNRLNRTEDATGHCFSYTPLDQSRVHNVNMLAAELLGRLFGITGDLRYREVAHRAVSYTLARQGENGSWVYGEADSQQWIDSFHTGFILVSLAHLIESFKASEWRSSLVRGLDFYRERFFLADGTPGYYHDRLYPIDVHSAAQAVITFVEMIDVNPDAAEMARLAVRWAIRNMQDGSDGFFYFQEHRLYRIKTAHMRWSQAWMLYALSLFSSRSLVLEDG